MTQSAAGLIRAEIEAHGPIPFARFMQLALYAPGCGYYTRTRDPFGKEGDFFTAEQLQPAFGILVAELARPMFERTDSSMLVELGAGRGEMAPYFADRRYIPVDAGDSLPEQFSGVVFCNEFFDALPVHLVRRQHGAWHEVRVALGEEGFHFARRTSAVTPEVAAYLARYHAEAVEGSVVEVNLGTEAWVRRVTRCVRQAHWIIIDYGYTAREWIRHSHGTLMAYHRHHATDRLLDDPGGRDLTAHVAWTPLHDCLSECGWKIESFETLASALLRAGEPSNFSCLLANCAPAEEQVRRMQLKQLLFGMGETFRVLIASR